MTTLRTTVVLPHLRKQAGVYAGRIARMWPAPHAGYFALPVARRHLAHIYAPRVGRNLGMDARAYARDLMSARLADFLRRWAPDAPKGLPSVCAKMGEEAWRPAEYRRLLALLAQCPDGAQTLRHAKAVTVDLVQMLEVLPHRLRRVAITRHLHKVNEAALVREAAVLVRRMQPSGDAIAKLAERLGRAETRERFFEMLLEALRPECLPQPFVGDALLHPLRTPAEVLDAGRRFRNCLAECLERASFGRSAFVEWRGVEPAVMELVFEGAAGWRLETLLGMQNNNVSRATCRQVLAALAGWGVRAGADARTLIHELEDLAEFAA